MKTFSKTYKNGLRLVLEQKDTDVVSSNILFFVGSENESKEEEGFSHFIEHMIFKSSENYSTEEINDKFTFYGADYNAYTSKTATRFIFKCLKENFEPCFEIYSDLLIRPKFDEEEMNKERNVVVEEMKKCEDDPVQVMYQRVMDNYFAGLSCAHDELGNEETIMSVSRETLLAYKNKFYQANNCIISVVGNIEFDELDRIVEKYFSSCFDYESKHYNLNKEKIQENIIKKYDTINRDDNQANVCIHIKSSSCFDEDNIAGNLYVSILGSSQNSRLFKRIREDLGLVYTIYAFADAGARKGEILIIFGTRPKNIKQAMTEVKKVIKDLAENGVSEDELQRAKNWKKSCHAFAWESSSDIAEANGTSEHLYEKILSRAERLERVEKVTKKEVDEFAKKIANETVFNVVAVGKNLNLADLEVF